MSNKLQSYRVTIVQTCRQHELHDKREVVEGKIKMLHSTAQHKTGQNNKTGKNFKFKTFFIFIYKTFKTD